MCFPPYISILACHWLLPGKSLYLVWPLPVIHHSSKTRLHGPRLPFLDGALNFIDWPSTFQFLQIFQPLPLQFSRAYLLAQVILFEVSQISISSSIIGNVMNIISYHEVSLIYKLGIACSTIPWWLQLLFLRPRFIFEMFCMLTCGLCWMVQSLELWDMAENRSMIIAAHDSLVSAVASSSSGLVASTGHDKYVKLWRWPRLWSRRALAVNYLWTPLLSHH